MSPDKLVRMANQIGTFFTHQGQGPDAEATAVAAIAKHLDDFWDPRMRQAIIAHVNAGGEGLDPPVKAAVERMATQERA